MLVMEVGLVKEFDTVPTLMGRRQSTFRAMVVEAGLAGEEGEGAADSEGAPAPNATAPSADEDARRAAEQAREAFAQRLRDEHDLK